MSNLKWSQAKVLFHEAVELESKERQSFLTLNCQDQDLRREVEELLLNYEESEDFIKDSAIIEAGLFTLENSKIGEKIGNYEIVREIGRGGMGAVYLGVRADDEFKQQVALKIVKRGMDTDFIVNRFRNERQILASLNHPNIARLFEGGTTQDNLPYFVMEFVEGQDLISYCHENELNLEERLTLFRQVCSAVSYAHQNLIVHRDLKPSNILVTAEGVPKLLDFGIAKILDPEKDNNNPKTTGIFRLLTPEYASPEQIRGEKITTTSDVYSLGVLLYELLTEQSPYQTKSKSYDEIIHAVCDTEPVVPSHIWQDAETRGRGATEKNRQISTTGTPSPFPPFSLSQLRGDLDNIIIKALKKETEMRYPSVQELSEDIRRHLEGLPVSAQPDTFIYRATKFFKRHQVGVWAGILILAILLAGIAATSWQASRANVEKAKAEQRFNDVRQLANSVVFEIHDSIQNLPGSTPSRELLVSRALDYLDKLAGEAEEDSSLQLELAAAYDKIGDIQGGLNTSHLGQREKARESYRKALAIREALVVSEPENVDFRRKLSGSYTKLGEISWVETDVAGTLEFHQKALLINQKLSNEMPGDAGIRYDLAITYKNFGHSLATNGRTEEALENTRQAIILFEELALADPNNTKIQTGLAISYDKVAEIHEKITKNYSEALVLYRKSQEISEKLLAADPQNTSLRRGQAVGFYNLANISVKLGDARAGLESSRNSLAIFTQMLSVDPQNEEFRQIVGAVQTVVCQMMIKTGSAAEAIKLLNDTLQSLEKLFAASPTDETVRFRIALVQAELGNAYASLASDDKTSGPKRLAHWREARSWFQKGAEIQKFFRDGGKSFGEDAARLDVINAEIVKCDAAIALLTGNLKMRN